ncbi:MAG: helix-turn-helix domain-containing protein [Nesterenkonia sp.]
MKTRSDQKHMSVQDLPHLMSTAEAAEYLGISPGTLNNWRSAEVGPDYAVIGRRVRYAAEDIDAWRRAHMVRTRESVA